MTIAEIATTGEVQERRSRNDTSRYVIARSALLRFAGRGNLSDGHEVPLAAGEAHRIG